MLEEHENRFVPQLEPPSPTFCPPSRRLPRAFRRPSSLPCESFFPSRFLPSRSRKTSDSNAMMSILYPNCSSGGFSRSAATWNPNPVYDKT